MTPESTATLVLELAEPVVLAFEKIFGEAKKGTDKKTMAKDALVSATTIALGNLTGDNAEYAVIAAAVAGAAIDKAVKDTRDSGTYQQATAAAKTLATPTVQVQSAQPVAA